ncbi:unnamed protein product, partial [Citrullus colocynthis]
MAERWRGLQTSDGVTDRRCRSREGERTRRTDTQTRSQTDGLTQQDLQRLMMDEGDAKLVGGYRT